jgi:hypothetical protein
MSAQEVGQIFLFLQVFIMGGLTVVAGHFAYKHYSQKPIEPQTDTQTDITPATPNTHYGLTTEAENRLVQEASKRFEDVLVNAAGELFKDLNVTTGHINNLVMRLASEVVATELERYRSELYKLHEHAKTTMGNVGVEVEKHKAEIVAQIDQELEAHRHKLLQQIDTKLGDAMGSFLLDTLQHNVDLGSQQTYLLKMLEEHKDEFKKEVTND